VLGVAGVLIVSFGQWLQGGHYAASALMWFLLGWAASGRDEPREQPANDLEREVESTNGAGPRLSQNGTSPAHVLN
jgi:hypothetical protein